MSIVRTASGSASIVTLSESEVTVVAPNEPLAVARVGDRAGVEVGLGHGVRGRAGDERPGPGWRDGQVSSVDLLSATVNGPVRVTLPVLVTLWSCTSGHRRPCRTTWSVDGLVEGEDGRLGGMSGLGVGRVGEVPPAGVPVAVALLMTVPASRSSWVTVWGAVQVATSPGARVVTSQTGAASRCRRSR